MVTLLVVRYDSLESVLADSENGVIPARADALQLDAPGAGEVPIYLLLARA